MEFSGLTKDKEYQASGPSIRESGEAPQKTDNKP